MFTDVKPNIARTIAKICVSIPDVDNLYCKLCSATTTDSIKHVFCECACLTSQKTSFILSIRQEVNAGIAEELSSESSENFIMLKILGSKLESDISYETDARTLIGVCL